MNIIYTCRIDTQDPSFKILTQEQIESIEALGLPISSIEIIRGAFHGAFTRLKILLKEGTKEDYTVAMIDIADAINWHYYPDIDGVECIVKQIDNSTTRGRWKRSHKRKGVDPRVAQKANTAYFEFMNSNNRFEKIKNIFINKEFFNSLSEYEKNSLYQEYRNHKRIQAYED